MDGDDDDDATTTLYHRSMSYHFHSVCTLYCQQLIVEMKFCRYNGISVRKFVARINANFDLLFHLHIVYVCAVHTYIDRHLFILRLSKFVWHLHFSLCARARCHAMPCGVCMLKLCVVYNSSPQ